MKNLLLLLTVTLTAISAHANLGDSRDDSDQRYGKPGSVNGSYVNYYLGNWIVSEWFNSTGYAVEIDYYKRTGDISQREIAKLQSANLQGPETWYPIKPKPNPNAKGHIWLSDDNNYRFESGVCRDHGFKHWTAYVSFATQSGHLQMLEYDERHKNDSDDDSRQTNNENDDQVPI
jgi:hypothetical protein